MAKQINCQCGYTIEGADDDELVANAAQRIQRDHLELAGQMSREQLLSMATGV